MWNDHSRALEPVRHGREVQIMYQLMIVFVIHRQNDWIVLIIRLEDGFLPRYRRLSLLGER